MPRPRLHLIRFHGVLAPNAKLRAMLVPHGPEQATGKSELTATEPGCAHGRPARISWARLLKRVFEIDIEHCPNCGGELKIIAAILEQPGTREDPHAPGSAGQSTAQGARPWVAAASGLRSTSQYVQGGPVTRAAGVGCARVSQGRVLRPHRPGNPQGKRYGRHPLGVPSVFNGLGPRPTTTWMRALELGGGPGSVPGGKKGV